MQVLSNALDKLTYTSFSFTARVIDEIFLPEYKGSSFRGAFGHNFRRITCVLKVQECSSCMLSNKCIYKYIFETSPPKDAENLKNLTNIPHPFIITPPLEDKKYYEAGSIIKFDLTLFGRAVEYLSYFALAFHLTGQNGIGRGLGKFVLETIEDDTGSLIYSSEEKTLKSNFKRNKFSDITDKLFNNNNNQISLNILTPIRLKYENRYISKLDFHILIRNLLRRLSNIIQFHCDSSVDFDFKHLIDSAYKIKITDDETYWYDWQRYSSRQDTRMNLGGILGKITYQGDLGQFYPYLYAGSVINAGKNTSFGMGKYEIVNSG